jgi:hypothetical protein
VVAGPGASENAAGAFDGRRGCWKSAAAGQTPGVEREDGPMIAISPPILLLMWMAAALVPLPVRVALVTALMSR